MQAKQQSVALPTDIQVEVEPIGADALGSDFPGHVQIDCPFSISLAHSASAPLRFVGLRDLDYHRTDRKFSREAVMTEPIRPQYDRIDHERIVQDTLTEAWNLFRNDFVLYILAGLLMIAVSIVSLGLLSGPMTVGFIKLVEKRRRGEGASVVDIFDGFSQFGESLIASILIGIGVFIGILLFIVPGLLFGFAMSFTFAAIAIDGETATGGMAKSYSVIKENLALSAVLLVIVLVLSGIGGAVVFGTFLTLPFNLILITLTYHRLRGG